MKTLIAILLLMVILWFGFIGDTKMDSQGAMRVQTPVVTTGDANGNFIPFSWQTKWFKKDLNGGVKFGRTEDC